MFKNNMKKRSLFLLFAVFLISISIPAFAINFAEETSDKGTYQTYKVDNRRTGGYSTNLGNQFVDNFFEKCSISSEGSPNSPTLVTKMDVNGINQIITFTSNSIKLYNGSCNLKNTLVTLAQQTGVPITFDLLRQNKSMVIVPETNGNISFYQKIGNSLTKWNSIYANGTDNEGISPICTETTDRGGFMPRDEDVRESPTCLWVSNWNSVCQFYSNDDSNLSQITNWTTQCNTINNSILTRTRRIPSIFTNPTFSDNPLLAFWYDTHNSSAPHNVLGVNTGVGLAVWDILSATPYSLFGSNGFVNGISTVNVLVSTACDTVYRNFLREGTTPLIIDFDDDGLMEIVEMEFFHTTNNCISFFPATSSLHVYKWDGTEMSGSPITISSQVGGTSAQYQVPSTEPVHAYLEIGLDTQDVVCVEGTIISGAGANNIRKCIFYNFGSNSLTTKFSLATTLPVSAVSPPNYAILHSAELNFTSSTIPDDENDEIIGRYFAWSSRDGGNLFNFTGFNNKKFQTPADLNGDGVLDLIFNENVSSQILWGSGTAGVINFAPTILTITPSTSPSASNK